MQEYNARREAKQPLEFASAGSTFKRPPGQYAGSAHPGSRLKGFSVGDAQVSQKHAGFVINRGNATSAQILQVIAAVQERVYAASGVRLGGRSTIIGEGRRISMYFCRTCPCDVSRLSIYPVWVSSGFAQPSPHQEVQPT